MKGKITLFGRQNSSGTYDYFREHICGKQRTPRRKGQQSTWLAGPTRRQNKPTRRRDEHRRE